MAKKKLRTDDMLHMFLTRRDKTKTPTKYQKKNAKAYWKRTKAKWI